MCVEFELLGWLGENPKGHRRKSQGSINNGQNQVTCSVCLSTHACIIYGRSRSNSVYSSVPARVSECLLTTLPLSKTYFVWTSPSLPKWTFPCSQDIFFFHFHVSFGDFFFFFLHFHVPFGFLSHATFFSAVFRKLISIQPPQLGRVNMHYSELAPYCIEREFKQNDGLVPKDLTTTFTSLPWNSGHVVL